MLDCRKIAITGGVSSGKSSVCRIFAALGAYTVDADAIVHRLLSPETVSGQQVMKLLGADIAVGGRLDRTRIAERVFGNPGLLKSLERILHPAVRSTICKEYEEVRTTGRYPLFIVEIPLLYESGLDEDYDAVIAVTAEEKTCLDRFQAKTGSTATDFFQRMAHQLSPEEKAVRADYVIVNNGDLQTLQQAIKELYPRLIGEQ